MPELIDVQPGTPEWHDARRQGVTATDIPVILGISTYDSAYSLYYRKRGELPDAGDNDRFRLGRELEPYILDRWQEDAERTVVKGGLYRSDDRPWQMATLDAFTYDTDEPVEVKSWADADKHTWDESPPPSVRAQLLWQMDTMSVARGHVAVVFLPSGEFRSFTLECSCEVEADTNGTILCELHEDILMMRSAGFDFHMRIIDGQPPSLDGSVATLAAVRARLIPAPGVTAEIEPMLLSMLRNYRAEVKEIEAAARVLEAKIREIAGEATVLTIDGQTVARRVIVNAPVKAHTRHSDYIRITNQKGTGDDQ
jgi:putative phage-type endonuclease